MKWLAVLDREDGWRLVGMVPHTQVKEGRKVRFVQRNWVVPTPEQASCFLAAHRIFEAQTKEEAWQSMLTFPKGK